MAGIFKEKEEVKEETENSDADDAEAIFKEKEEVNIRVNIVNIRAKR